MHTIVQFMVLDADPVVSFSSFLSSVGISVLNDGVHPSDCLMVSSNAGSLIDGMLKISLGSSRKKCQKDIPLPLLYLVLP